MDDLITEFTAETRDMLAALGAELVAWENAPEDRARLDAIFRFVHTVKGNSGFFDLPRLTALSHAAEDALSDVRAGRRKADRALVSAVLAAIDRIGELVEAVESGADAPLQEDEPILAALSGAAPLLEASAAQPRVPARSIRLSLDLLDRMMNGISDLVLARNELARRLRSAEPEVEAAFDRVTASVAEVREAVTRTRMQRVDTLLATLPRMVRDLCGETGRKVTLAIDGGDVELDREMIEMIRDPLTHMVRNAVGHGIEPPEERRRAGKPETGLLRVGARQAGNQILISIADDGRGIDEAGLAARAVAAGLVSEEEAARLPRERRLALMFEPGLSTAREVTELSGRGVGMDVVRANIERIGGVVDIESAPGEGTSLTLRVPLTLTIIAGLTVEAGGQTFAIPRSAIEEIVRVPGPQVRLDRLAGAAVLTIRGRRLPALGLGQVLGCACAAEEPLLVLLKTAGGGAYALAVETVHDHEELVVKPAAPPVMATGLYAGTTLGEDGCPVLLLDPAGLAAAAGLSLSEAAVEAPAEDRQASAESRPALLFRSTDGARRAVALGAVARVEEVPSAAVGMAGGRLHVTLGEELLPLAGCQSAPDGETLRVLRLSDGGAEIAYAVAEVLDTVELPAELVPAPGEGEVQGVALVGGAPAELLDLHRLFAGCAARRVGAGAPLCVLAGDEAWADSFLRPIVEAAGYRVARACEAEAASADLVIVDGHAVPPPTGAGRVIRLRTEAEPAGEGDDSIHRYDRAALAAALRSTAKRA
jgi:two-component system chemotaxis sensor kinase CheA